MSDKYKVLERAERALELDRGDLCTLLLPDGNLTSGRILNILPVGRDANDFFTIWFDDGRSYPVSTNPTETCFCHVHEAFIDADYRRKTHARFMACKLERTRGELA